MRAGRPDPSTTPATAGAPARGRPATVYVARSATGIVLYVGITANTRPPA
jgi:hypothetical protein